MLEYLLNKSPVASRTTPTTSPHGALFYAAFRSVLNAFLAQHTRDAVPLLVKHATGAAADASGVVGNLLVGVMDHIGRDREFRKK